MSWVCACGQSNSSEAIFCQKCDRPHEPESFSATRTPAGRRFKGAEAGSVETPVAPAPREARRFAKEPVDQERAAEKLKAAAVEAEQAERKALVARLAAEGRAEETRKREEAEAAESHARESARKELIARLNAQAAENERVRAENARIQEARRAAEEARLAEEARVEELRKQEQARVEELRKQEQARVEELRKQEEAARIAEEARVAEEAHQEKLRKEEEARAADQARLEAEQARAAEEARREELRNAEEARRIQDEAEEQVRRAVEAARLEVLKREEEERIVEAARKREVDAVLAEEEARAARVKRDEQGRLAEEARMLAEEARKEAETQSREEERRILESRQKAAEERKAEELRLAEEFRRLEEAREAEAHGAANQSSIEFAAADDWFSGSSTIADDYDIFGQDVTAQDPFAADEDNEEPDTLSAFPSEPTPMRIVAEPEVNDEPFGYWPTDETSGFEPEKAPSVDKFEDFDFDLLAEEPAPAPVDNSAFYNTANDVDDDTYLPADWYAVDDATTADLSEWNAASDSLPAGWSTQQENHEELPAGWATEEFVDETPAPAQYVTPSIAPALADEDVNDPYGLESIGWTPEPVAPANNWWAEEDEDEESQWNGLRGDDSALPGTDGNWDDFEVDVDLDVPDDAEIERRPSRKAAAKADKAERAARKRPTPRNNHQSREPKQRGIAGVLQVRSRVFMIAAAVIVIGIAVALINGVFTRATAGDQQAAGTTGTTCATAGSAGKTSDDKFEALMAKSGDGLDVLPDYQSDGGPIDFSKALDRETNAGSALGTLESTRFVDGYSRSFVGTKSVSATSTVYEFANAVCALDYLNKQLPTNPQTFAVPFGKSAAGYVQKFGDTTLYITRTVQNNRLVTAAYAGGDATSGPKASIALAQRQADALAGKA